MTQTERELLEALKRLTNYTFDRSYCGGLKNTACHCTEDCPIVQEIALARAAIAKAEAEQAERVEPVEEMQDEIERLHEIIETNKFYQQGHQDALEWAAQCIEYDDPRTGDWMWDDRDVLAAVVRKGFELPYFATPPAAAVSEAERVEPVAWEWKTTYKNGGYTRYLCVDKTEAEGYSESMLVDGVIKPLYYLHKQQTIKQDPSEYINTKMLNALHGLVAHFESGKALATKKAHIEINCREVKDLYAAIAAAEQAERVEPAKPVAWYIKEHGDIVDLEWDTNKPNTTWGDWKPLYTAPPAAALEGGTVASGNIVGAVASGNIVGAVASGNQLSGAHNIRSK